MSEKSRSILAIVVSVVALAVIIFGVFSEPAAEASREDRVAALSASIRCPFCNGESLADSQANVAADYRALIAEQIEAGATDEDISFFPTTLEEWTIIAMISPITPP